MRLVFLALLAIGCGNAELIERPCPLSHSGTPYVIKLSSNDTDTFMALRSDGKALCWGAAPGGQCGFKTGYGAEVPTESDVVRCASDVGLGETVGAMVNQDHHVLMWGDESPVYAEFGMGPEPIQLAPGESSWVWPLPAIAKLRVYGGTVFAITGTGQVYWWGAGGPGGSEGTLTVSYRPKLLALARPAVDMSGTCVLVDDGRVFCFGPNRKGQLGNGSTEDASVLTPALFERPVLGISLRRDLCGVLDDHSVACSGTRLPGPDPNNLPSSSIPIRIDGLPPVDRVYSGWEGVCAFAIGGQLYCWGAYPIFGGEGGTTPFPVVELPDVLDVAKAGVGFCALRSDHSVWCAGTETFHLGQLVQVIPPPGDGS